MLLCTPTDLVQGQTESLNSMLRISDNRIKNCFSIWIRVKWKNSKKPSRRWNFHPVCLLLPSSTNSKIKQIILNWSVHFCLFIEKQTFGNKAARLFISIEWMSFLHYRNGNDDGGGNSIGNGSYSRPTITSKYLWNRGARIPIISMCVNMNMCYCYSLICTDDI